MSDQYEQEAQRDPVESGALEDDDGAPARSSSDEPVESGALEGAQQVSASRGDEGERDRAP
jgi:hypothetical protein